MKDVTGFEWYQGTYEKGFVKHGVNATKRLAMLRKKAAELSERRNLNFTWRDVRFYKHWIPAIPTRNGDKTYFDYDTLGTSEGSAEEILRNRNIPSGYYVDGFEYGTLVGYVYKIRCSKGVLYCPVTICDDWDGATYYMDDAFLVPKGSVEDDHYDAIRDCARRADDVARIEAENHRDAWTKDQAEQIILNSKEEIVDIRQSIKQAVTEIRALPKLESCELCKRVKNSIKQDVARIKELRKTITDYTENPYMAMLY